MSNDPEQFKQHIQSTFNLVADGYDHPALRYFPFAADRMVQKLGLKPGEKVLDIATGTGQVAIAAAQRIAPAGRVHAIDFAEDMLTKAQANLSKYALDNVDLHRMDAAQLEFRPRYFDVITCGFGIFFLPDMAKGIEQCWRVLKPGGRIMLTSFGHSAFQPYADLFRDTLARYDVTVPEAGWQRLTEPAACRQLVSAAGFTEVEVSVEQMGYHMQSEQDWWQIVWNSGFRGLLNPLPPARQAEFRAQHLAQIASARSQDGIWLDVTVLFTQAYKPLNTA